MNRTSSRVLLGLWAIAAVAMPLLARGQAGVVAATRNLSYDSWAATIDTSGAGSGDMGYVWTRGDLSLRPHLGVWGIYDDNIFLDPQGRDEVSDYSYTFAPGLMAMYGNPARNYLSANYRLEEHRYVDHTEANYMAHELAVDGHYSTSKDVVHVADRFSRAQQASFETSERVNSTQNALDGSVERLISSKTSVALEGLYELHDYQESRLIDYNEYRAGARFYYRAWPKTDLFGDFGYGWVDLQPLPEENRRELSQTLNTPISSSRGDARYQEASVGLRGEVGSKTEATGRVGYQHRTFDGADQISDIDDWVAALNLVTRFSSRFLGGLEVSRRIYPWATVPGNSAVATLVNPYVQRQLWRNRVSISGSVGFEQVDYYGPADNTDRTDRLWTFTTMVDWKPRNFYSFGLGYSYTRDVSSESEHDATSNRVIARAMINY